MRNGIIVVTRGARSAGAGIVQNAVRKAIEQSGHGGTEPSVFGVLVLLLAHSGGRGRAVSRRVAKLLARAVRARVAAWTVAALTAASERLRGANRDARRLTVQRSHVAVLSGHAAALHDQLALAALW